MKQATLPAEVATALGLTEEGQTATLYVTAVNPDGSVEVDCEGEYEGGEAAPEEEIPPARGAMPSGVLVVAKKRAMRPAKSVAVIT